MKAWLLIFVLTTTITNLKCYPSETAEVSYTFPNVIKIDYIQKWNNWGLVEIRMWGRKIGEGWVNLDERKN
jgi:hypothetical protein